MSETPKRLAPTSEILRELFLKSGNLCAFPGCDRLMMNASGVFIGQLCHIEAAEEGGERFKKSMTNEQRRAAANLMLMCYEHHQITNDVKKYPVEELRHFKQDHERRFSHPDRAILRQLKDLTRSSQPTESQNLRRINDVLGWELGSSELKQSAKVVNTYIKKIQRVPLDVRRFLGAVAQRIIRVEKTRAVSRDFTGTSILVSDVKGAFGMSERAVVELANQLQAYGLGSVSTLDTELGPRDAVSIRDLDGWPLWIDVAKFCEKAPEPMESFSVDLDFGRLDA